MLSDFSSKETLWGQWQDAKRAMQEDVARCLRRQEAIVSQLLKDAPRDDQQLPPMETMVTHMSQNMEILDEIVDVGEFSVPKGKKVGWGSAGTINGTAPLPADASLQNAKINVPMPFSPTEVPQPMDLAPETIPDGTGTPPPEEQGHHLAIRRPCSLRKSAAGGYVIEYEHDEEQADGEHEADIKKAHIRELTFSDILSSKLDQIFKMMPVSEEPDREGFLADFARSSAFNACCPIVILSDATYSTWSSNRSAEAPHLGPSEDMQIIEGIFTAFYVSELILKLLVHRRYYFSNDNMYWNIFDFVLVMQSMSDIVLTYLISSGGGSVTFMRLLRLLKLGKILRLFRAVRFLRDLSVMIVAIMNCMIALFWAFTVLALVLYVFALMMVQSMTGWRQENLLNDRTTLPDEMDYNVRKYFDSVEKCILFLFMSATGGISWIEMYEVVQLGGALVSIAYIFFIGFFGFAVITILSGIFIEKALSASAPDRESMALEQRRQEEQEAEQMKDLILSMDVDNSGTLTLEEFSAAADDLYVKSYLRSLGLDIHDGVMFFSLLTSLSGVEELDIEDFVKRLGRMKGTATAMDLQSMMFELSIFRKDFADQKLIIKAMGDKMGIVPMTPSKTSSKQLPQG